MAEGKYVLMRLASCVRVNLAFRRYPRSIPKCGCIHRRRSAPLPLLLLGRSLMTSQPWPLTPHWSNSAIRVQSSPFHIDSIHNHSRISELSSNEYEKLVDVTLDELTEFFEDLGDSGLCHKDFEAVFADGVLTIHIGGGAGTYVINKQTPNKQIWLSSPISGPKRYDVIDGRWRYSHDNVALHDLLSEEFSELLGTEIDLTILGHSSITSFEDNWA